MPRLRLGDRLRGGAAAFHGSWANPDLRRAQLCFAGAWTAEWALTVGLGVLAFQHGGAAAVGAVSLLRMLPAAVITPFAAIYGDRWRRERILVMVTGGRGAALLLMAVLASLDVAVTAVYALSVVATITGVLFRPVHSALMPSLCRTPTELAGANVVRSDSLLALGPMTGVKLVWVIDPPHRSVRVHRADGTVTDLRETDELSGEAVVAGFRCGFGELFQSPAAAAE